MSELPHTNRIATIDFNGGNDSLLSAAANVDMYRVLQTRSIILSRINKHDVSIVSNWIPCVLTPDLSGKFRELPAENESG